MSNPTPIGIYSIDYINDVWGLLVPPNDRQPNFLAWGAAVMAGKQWKGDALFGSYALGAGSTPYYISTTTYSVGNRVVFGIRNDGHGHYGDNAVYEYVNNTPGSLPPSGANVVPSIYPAYIQTAINNNNWTVVLAWVQQYAWVQVQANFMGAFLRASFSAQKLTFEYALNLWFNTTFKQPSVGTSDIYISVNTITNNQFYFFPQGDISFFSPETIFSPSPATAPTLGPPSRFFKRTSAFTMQNDFTIHVPTAVYDSLSTTSGLRTGIVQNFANLLCPAGAFYNVVTY